MREKGEDTHTEREADKEAADYRAKGLGMARQGIDKSTQRLRRRAACRMGKTQAAAEKRGPKRRTGQVVAAFAAHVRAGDAFGIK